MVHVSRAELLLKLLAASGPDEHRRRDPRLVVARHGVKVAQGIGDLGTVEASDDADAAVAIERQRRVMADEALAAGPGAGPALGVE